MDTPMDCVSAMTGEVDVRLASTILAHGLASLPNEILPIIFLHSMDFSVDGDDDDWRTTLRLATVCQRFREIALRIPMMWLSITMDTRRPDALSTFLLRSGSCSLSVHFTSNTPSAYIFFRKKRNH